MVGEDTRADRLLEYFGVVCDDAPDREVFSGGLVPFIRARQDDDTMPPARFTEQGIFRFVPDFVASQVWARNTHNARSEELLQKRTYKRAWLDGQRCIIPAEAIYEPYYADEHAKSVRWKIALASGEPMGIAGIWRAITRPDGEVVFGISMLTVNADHHPVMKQFHAPGHEKRMVCILDPKDYSTWLSRSLSPDEAIKFCKTWDGPLDAQPAPLPPRTRKSVKPPSEPPEPSGGTNYLF